MKMVTRRKREMEMGIGKRAAENTIFLRSKWETNYNTKNARCSWGQSHFLFFEIRIVFSLVRSNRKEKQIWMWETRGNSEENIFVCPADGEAASSNRFWVAKQAMVAYLERGSIDCMQNILLVEGRPFFSSNKRQKRVQHGDSWFLEIFLWKRIAIRELCESQWGHQ